MISNLWASAPKLIHQWIPGPSPAECPKTVCPEWMRLLPTLAAFVNIGAAAGHRRELCLPSAISYGALRASLSAALSALMRALSICTGTEGSAREIAARVE